MRQISFRTPASEAELIHCLGEGDAGTYLLGGGTDLIVRMRDRGVTRATLVDVTRVPGWASIETRDGLIRIGSNVTYTQLAGSQMVRRKLPCLAAMAAQVGSPQIRNAARLAGNIATASPAGDSIGTLMALDASAEILDSKGRITIRRIADVVIGSGRTILARDDVIRAILVPEPAGSLRSGYGKLGLGARRQMVIANVSLTMVIDYQADRNAIQSAKVVVGSAAPRAYHALSAEGLLQGRSPDRRLAQDLADVLRQEVETSIKGVEAFRHKTSDVQGLAMDVFCALFPEAT